MRVYTQIHTQTKIRKANILTVRVLALVVVISMGFEPMTT